jgi:hypothetical protein
VRPGDLVKFSRELISQIGKYHDIHYIILEIDEFDWVRISDGSRNLYHYKKDFVVISAA